MSKQLILLRHAKTEPFSENGVDFSRKLTDRGWADIMLTGKQLRPLADSVQHVFCSTAARARQTYEGITSYLPANVEVTYTDAIYLASQPDLFALINEFPDTADYIMMVGHNPGFHELTQSLSGGMLATFPTTTAAVLNSDIAQWKDISPGAMRLDQLIHP